MRNAFVSFIVGFLTFSPLLFSGCAESHDSIPAALADSCGDMGYAETMGPVEQSTMLNAAGFASLAFLEPRRRPQWSKGAWSTFPVPNRARMRGHGSMSARVAGKPGIIRTAFEHKRMNGIPLKRESPNLRRATKINKLFCVATNTFSRKFSGFPSFQNKKMKAAFLCPKSTWANII
jgi:hypothetical protein